MNKIIDVIVDMLEDELYKELKEKQPQSRDEANKIADSLTTKICGEIGCALEDMTSYYCDDKGLRWLDEWRNTRLNKFTL